MALTEDQRKKILTQALFLTDHAEFEVTSIRGIDGFRSLMMALFQVMYPDFELSMVDGTPDFTVIDPSVDGPITARAAVMPSRLHATLDLSGNESGRRAILDLVIPHLENFVVNLRQQISAIGIRDGQVVNATHELSTVIPLLKTGPMIKGMTEGPLRRGLPTGPDHDIPNWAFVDRVRFVAAFDLPENFQFIDRSMLADLEITEDGLRDRALENLRTRAGKIKFRTDYKKPVNEIDRLGGLASSLLLLPEFWEKEALKARDELVVHVADYDVLYVVRKNDTPTLRSMVGAAFTGQVPSVFHPPILFVFGQDGMRVLTQKDVG